MTSILISIVIILVVAVAMLVVFARKEAKKHDTSAKEEFIGICKSAVETASQKKTRKQKALAMFGSPSTSSGNNGSSQGNKEFFNAEIRKALGVSSRTAVRYLDELEKEGKIEQVGKIGHAVTYRLR